MIDSIAERGTTKYIEARGIARDIVGVDNNIVRQEDVDAWSPFSLYRWLETVWGILWDDASATWYGEPA